MDLDVTTKVLRFIEQNPDKLRFHDQDALNAVLHDRWTLLHPKWNAQGYILSKAKNIRLFMEKDNMKKREEHHPLSTLLAMSNLGRKNFSGIPSVIMINMRTGLPFVVQKHLVNIFLMPKIVKLLNTFDNPCYLE